MATNWLVVLKAYVDTLETIVGTEGGASLANKLTAARAAFLDAAISSRSTLTQAQVLSDATPFAGANIAAIVAYVDTLETAIGAIEGATALHNKLTAARAALLDQITALRMAELDAANIPADIDTLLARLTALRAGYLDNLSAGAVALAATALSTAVWTAVRAAFLDNLAAAVSVVGSPFSLVNNLLEQDAIIIAAATQLVDIELDMSNLAQANTVREYVQVDGVNYRQVSAKVFPTVFDTGTKAIILSFSQKGQLYKVTMQSSVLEGVAKNVPYRIMTRDLS